MSYSLIYVQSNNLSAATTLYKQVKQLQHENNYEEMVFSLDKARTFSLPGEVKQAEGFYCYEEEQINHSLSEVIREIVADYFT